jgi:hypothetical protein
VSSDAEVAMSIHEASLFAPSGKIRATGRLELLIHRPQHSK